METLYEELIKQHPCDSEKLDENLEKAYTDAEFDELIDYFVALNSGNQVEDPRPQMSFINPTMEKRAKEYASFISTIIDVFDGKLEK